MQQIKVGEYVRTNGRIYKVLDMDNAFLYVDKEVRYSEEYNASIDYINRDEYEIEKHSTNIIDLIEVGDYVNGEKVLQIQCKLEYIDDDSDTGVNEVDDGLELEKGWIYFEHEIKTILTKEQYKANCYEV